MSVPMLRTTMALVASLGLLLAGPAGAAEGKVKAKAKQKELTFQGDVVSVDVPAQEFTVKGLENGTTSEMTFHVARPTSVQVDGETVLLRQLKKGEHVTVTYKTSGSTHLAKHVHRHKESS